MKRYLLSLLVVWLTFIGFSNAQFTYDELIEQSFSIAHSRFVVLPVVDWDLTISLDTPNVGCVWLLKSNGSSQPPDPYCWKGCVLSRDYIVNNNVKYLFFSQYDAPWCDSISSASWKFIYNRKSDLVPVSELSPIINWLENSISEFIPYVVYVSLWILGAVIWFYAIKWLLRFVKWSSLSVFSSRKRK